MKATKGYTRLVRNLAQILSLSKLYSPDHPIVMSKIADAYKETAALMEAAKNSLVIARSADIFFVNGEKIDADDKMVVKFIEDFIELQLGSVELDPGITEREFGVFAGILCRKDGIIGTDAIKKFLTDQKAAHIIAHAASFKLVRDDENIIKKGSFVKIADLPPQVLEKFSKDLTGGSVGEALKKEDSDYKAAAHDPVFLAGLAADLVGSREAAHDPEKILWLLADYLIEEVSTAREEEINQKILENVKEKLLSGWRDNPEKRGLAENVEKTYMAINAALQLKGLLALYKKHKKELETTSRKIKGMIEKLPADSRLCSKIRQDLVKLGAI